MGGASPTVLAMLAVAVLAAGLAAAKPSGTDDTIRLPSSDGAADGRPWKCCDWVERRPGPIRPPSFRCNDVADKCSPSCHKCKKASTPVGDVYVCRDWIIWEFEPPVCTPRPWDCCDTAVCTRSIPPTCRCGDEFESCPSNCKECEQVEESEDGRPRYRCLDRFHGYPGPKCTPWITNNGN